MPMAAFCGIVIAGFLTAAGFLCLAQASGAVLTCMIIAGIYAIIGVIGFLVLLLMQDRRHPEWSDVMAVPTA